MKKKTVCEFSFKAIIQIMFVTHAYFHLSQKNRNLRELFGKKFARGSFSSTPHGATKSLKLAEIFETIKSRENFFQLFEKGSH